MMNYENCRIFKKRRDVLNIFYSLILEIEKSIRDSGKKVFVQFEPKLHGIKPDAALKFESNTPLVFSLCLFEFKDSGREDNIIKPEQLLKYDEITREKLVASGQKIARDSEFKELLLIFRVIDDNKEIISKVRKNIKKLISEFKHENILKSYYIEEKTSMSFSLNAIISSQELENYMKKSYQVKTWNIFVTDIDFPRRFQQEPKEQMRCNLSVFFAIVLGYIFRIYPSTNPFKIEDVIKYEHEYTWRIIKDSHSKERIISFFQTALEKTLVSKGILKKISAEEYIINPEKNLRNKNVIRSVISTIKKYIDESFFSTQYVQTLPLFAQNSEQ